MVFTKKKKKVLKKENTEQYKLCCGLQIVAVYYSMFVQDCHGTNIRQIFVQVTGKKGKLSSTGKKSSRCNTLLYKQRGLM